VHGAQVMVLGRVDYTLRAVDAVRPTLPYVVTQGGFGDGYQSVPSCRLKPHGPSISPRPAQPPAQYTVSSRSPALRGVEFLLIFFLAGDDR
jgi:hypothetical protein